MEIEQKRPLLAVVLPALADELRRILRRESRDDLADQVDRIRVYDKCQCGDDFCSSIYAAPKPEGAWGPMHETIAMDPDSGMINVDVVEGEIVYIEIIDRADIKQALEQAIK